MVVRCSALMATKLKHITKAPILARYNAPKMRRNIPYIMRNELSLIHISEPTRPY